MTTPAHNTTVLLGIGGGVAAYKAVAVASSLHQAGFAVSVAMTPAAQKFVTPLTFLAVTNRAVLTSIFPDNDADNRAEIYPHLYPATTATICILLPATADLIAKIAHGMGDDIVSASVLSLPTSCRRYFCPAMNVEMWNQPVVQGNVARLGALGWQRIGPDSGYLACGAVGAGRMAEPEAIVAMVMEYSQHCHRLAGKRILVLSGPTIEHLDPVRFISNHSSGKMGRAIAMAAVQAGAQVDFVTGPVSPDHLPHDAKITITTVTSATDMLAAAEAVFSHADATVFVAAVADYTPADPKSTKEPKTAKGLRLFLMPTPDIAARLGAKKKSGQICIGFAVETAAGADKRAQEKLRQKSLDAIVLNSADAFGADNAEFRFLAAKAKRWEPWGKIDKSECGRRIVDKIAELIA